MRFRARMYVADPDGRVAQVSPDDGIYYQATIRPDSGSLIFYGGTDGPPRLWRKDLASGTLDAVTEEQSGARHPAFSWDGQWVAFVSDRASPVPGERMEELNSSTRKVRPDTQLNLYVSREDGSEIRQITEGPYRDLRPTFTPDGQSLVFASDRRAGPTLWSVDLAPISEPRPILDEGWGYRPWCTPDGHSIVFYGPGDGRHQLFVLNRSGGSITPVRADDKGDTHGPFVGRDSTRVLAHSTRGGEWGLWEFPLEGEDPPRCVTPPGFSQASHPTQSAEGKLAFDVVDN